MRPSAFRLPRQRLISLCLTAAASAAVAISSASSATPAIRRTHVLRAVRVVSGLQMPLYVAAEPGDTSRIYVVEQRGIVRVLERGTLQPKPFLDLSDEVLRRGEGGLLSIVFQRHDGVRYLFADYAQRDLKIDIVRYPIVEGRPDRSRGRLLLQLPAGPSPHHFGGQLAVGPDGSLYISAGDGGYRRSLWPVAGCAKMSTCPDLIDPYGNAQNLHVLRGKLIRLNPYETHPHPQIVGYGLRNPWRFSFDRSGNIYIGDVGWNLREEVDYLPRGWSGLANFGWSVYEGDQRLPGAKTTLNSAGTLVHPLTVYDHSNDNCSIVGGYVYEGRLDPSLRGRYVYGDFCSGRIWSLLVADGKATDIRVEAPRLRGLDSFGEDASGELYAVTAQGSVFQLR